MCNNITDTINFFKSLKMGFIRQIVNEGGNQLLPYIYLRGAKGNFCAESPFTYLRGHRRIKKLFFKACGHFRLCEHLLSIGNHKWMICSVITTAVLCWYCIALCAENKVVMIMVVLYTHALHSLCTWPVKIPRKWLSDIIQSMWWLRLTTLGEASKPRPTHLKEGKHCRWLLNEKQWKKGIKLMLELWGGWGTWGFSLTRYKIKEYNNISAAGIQLQEIIWILNQLINLMFNTFFKLSDSRHLHCMCGWLR